MSVKAGAWRKVVLLSLAVLPLTAAVSASAAVPAGAAEEGGIETVVVTAQKRAENVQDVPASITAIGDKALAAAGVGMAKELGALTTNVDIDFNANFVAPYIRGVGTQYANPGLEPSVATYMDDVYISRASAGLLSFSDISRVEVLKGPQGTLYGMSDTGGAIRIITKDPTTDFHAGLGLIAGNIGQKGVDGYVSGSLSDDVQGRLAFQYDHNDGYVTSIIPGGPNLEDRNLLMGRGKLYWNVTSRLTVKLMADYTNKLDHEGQAFLSLFPGAPEETGVALGGIPSSGFYKYGDNYTASNKMHLQAGGAELRIDYDFDDFTLSSITGFRHTLFSGYADLDTTSVPLINAHTIGELTEAWSEEVQAVSKGDGPLTWVSGIMYYHEIGKDNFGVSGLGVGPNTFVGGVGKESYDSLAPYAQVTYKITPEWEVLAGARVTVENKNLESNTVYLATTSTPNGFDFIPSSVTPFFFAPADKFTSSTFSPKVEITWRPMQDVMLYASYTRGYKSGGFNLPQPSPAPVQRVSDEQLDSVELGWKTQFGPVQFDGAYFHYKVKDMQVQITDPHSGITNLVNAGAASTNGVEADVNVQAAEGLVLGGSIGWMDAKFTQFLNGQANVPCIEVPADPGCIAQGGLGLATLTIPDLAGNQLPLSPNWTANLRLNYSTPLPNDLGTFEVSAVSSYTGMFSYTSDNNFNEPAKWLLNGSVGWISDDDHWGIHVFGTNLTNKAYTSHQSPFTTGGWFVPAPPREYGVRLSFDY